MLMINPFKFRSLLLLGGILFLSKLALSGSHSHYDQAAALISEIDEILISENYCKSSADCVKKNFIFFASGGGVYIDAYKITGKVTIDKIVKATCRVAKNTPGTTYHVSFHAGEKGGGENIIIKAFKLGKEDKCH